jgi:hypothetical protein
LTPNGDLALLKLIFCAMFLVFAAFVVLVMVTSG